MNRTKEMFWPALLWLRSASASASSTSLWAISPPCVSVSSTSVSWTTVSVVVLPPSVSVMVV